MTSFVKNKDGYLPHIKTSFNKHSCDLRTEKLTISKLTQVMTAGAESVGPGLCVREKAKDYQIKNQGKVEETTYIVGFVPLRVIGSVADTGAVGAVLPRDWLVCLWRGRRAVTSFLFESVVPALHI